MNKQLIAYGVAVIVALLTAGLALNYKNKLDRKESEFQQQLREQEAKLAAATAQEAALAQQQAETARLAQQAEEAKAMALAQAEKERLAKEALVAELNARLAQEAQSRRAAEAEQAELAQKMAALQQAQVEARAALTQLEKDRATADQQTQSEEDRTLAKKLAQQEAELAQLAQENEMLKTKQLVLLEKQMATEEAILEAGGRITIPFPEIRSPYARRREAIYFKERVISHEEEDNQ